MMHRYSISIVSNISFARSYNGSTASVPHAGHPCGRRHQRRTRPHSPTKFQSTPPARAATRRGRLHAGSHDVSIHAARAGGDSNARLRWRPGQSFNPRRPRGRRHHRNAPMPIRAVVSIHAARAGGDKSADSDQQARMVSIHAARAGGDRVARCTTVAPYVFQSTPPARAATPSDRPRAAASLGFNPRRPRGRRHWTLCLDVAGSLFQSTPPARAAT